MQDLEEKKKGNGCKRWVRGTMFVNEGIHNSQNFLYKLMNGSYTSKSLCRMSNVEC